MRCFAAIVAISALLSTSSALAQTARSESPAQTGPISGYMELHLNKPVDSPGQPPILDFHRFVLLVNHRFSDRLRFVGELELEHAVVEGLEEKGELELEQAYIDMLFSPAFNVRAGMLLVPVGIINERHEPPVFHGVERPFVDTVIVPTTWFDAGAGIHGELGGRIRYRTYVMAPLDSAEFSAEEGLRGGAQKGAEAQVRNVAWTGRLEYIGVPGLQVGTSFWRGDSSVTLPRTDTKVGVVEADARFRRQRFEGRAQYAHVFISNADVLNDAIGRLTGISPNVARQVRGFYFEGAYRVLPRDFPHDLAVFLRYENFDTQYRMPAGFQPLKEFDREAWVVGATYYPDPDVAVKVDYVFQRNQSSVVRAPHSFNIGLGWWF